MRIRSDRAHARLSGHAAISALAGALVMAAVIVPAAATSTAPAAVAPAETPAPDDPLQIVVSLGDQTMTVYRGLTPVATSPVSSGQRGYETPRGIFSILEKRRKHFSNLYDNAPMPFMQRLTWSGVALHQGRLPGYPASHGCIRLPETFAEDLFGITARGAHVVVATDSPAIRPIDHPALFQPAVPAGALISAAPAEPAQVETEVADLALKGPILASVPAAGSVAALEAELGRIADWRGRSKTPLRVLITLETGVDRTRDVQDLLSQLGYEPGPVDGAMGPKTARALAAFQEDEGMTGSGIIDEAVVAALFEAAGRDGPHNARLYVRQDFKPVFDAPVTIRGGDTPVGTHLYTALDFAAEDNLVRWMAVTAEADGGMTAADALDRIVVPDAIRQDIAHRMRPGSSLIVTDRGFESHTTLGTDFIVRVR